MDQHNHTTFQNNIHLSLIVIQINFITTTCISAIVTIYLTNILVRYLGIENLTNAFSIVTMVRGLGSMSGPPLAGE